jgi:quercetin dioxygenase-like cupin family protein
VTMPSQPSKAAGIAPAGWAPTGILRPAADAEATDLGPNRAVFALSGDETGGTYSLTAFTMAPPPAPGPPPHFHEDADEAVYVLDGTLEMGLGEHRLTGSAGAVMLVPRGKLRSLANPGPSPVRMLIILSPPRYEGFWPEMAALGGPPDSETVLALQRKYHLATDGQARRFD